MVWPLGLKKPGLTDRGVATGITKFCMASGGLIKQRKKSRTKVSFSQIEGATPFKRLQKSTISKCLPEWGNENTGPL